MSKTTPTLERVRAPLASCRGVPSIVQGTYGAVGNLELVVPDASDGLWVHWLNLDPEDARPGACSGRWSAGLHIAGGRRFEAAAALEVVPTRTLDVIASSDGQLLRTSWSAESGFRDLVPLGIAAASVSIAQDPRSLELRLIGPSPTEGLAEGRFEPSGTWEAIASSSFAGGWGSGDDAPGPPEIVAASITFLPSGIVRVAVAENGELWRSDSCGARRMASGVRAGAVALVDPDGELEVVAIDGRHGLRLCSATADLAFAASLGHVDAVTACRVDRGGRGIAVVAQVGGRLWWCPPPGVEGELRLVETEAWMPAGSTAINRRPR